MILVLQVDGDGGHLVAGDGDLYEVGRLIICGDGLFSFFCRCVDDESRLV